MADMFGNLQTALRNENSLSNSKDEILTILQRILNVPGGADTLMQDSGEIIATACKHGYLEVLQLLSKNEIDLNCTYNGENPVQIACRNNQKDVLEMLLLNDYDILPNGVEAWHEESPFYIASALGDMDIVQKLIAHNPSSMRDCEVRNCLLYAACGSGNTNVVKMWLSPGIDINQPLKLVQDLTNCEQKTPLKAACLGGHSNVIDFLMQNCDGLQLTESICNEHPEVVGKIISKFIQPVVSNEYESEDLFQFHTGYLQNKNLHALHELWLMPYRLTLRELDVSNNYLTQLPSCLPWVFQNLLVFNVARNSIKYLNGPTTNTDEQLCLSLEEFNLSYNHLEIVCNELFYMPLIKTLNLSHNRLSYLYRSYHQDAELQHDQQSLLNWQSTSKSNKKWLCSNLQNLDVSHNALLMLPTEIQNCTRLVSLVANNNKLSTFPQPWSCLLEILNLSHNELERFPVNTEQYWCTSLRYLNISHNLLDEINEGIIKLSVLSDLIASNNKIERLPAHDIWECGHLHQLNLKHNHLGLPVAESSSMLRNFPLHLDQRRTQSASNNTRQIQFPSILSSCLKELRLSDNNLDCVPFSICDLKNLEVLDLSNILYHNFSNPLIKTLPRELGKLKCCTLLKLSGVTPSNVPAEYLSGNINRTKEILSFLLENLRDCKPYNKIKAVILGKKDKGKTTLVNILANKKPQAVQVRKSIVCEEVTLVKKSFPLKKDIDIKLNIWDISGDQVYMHIHHSMFTPHSLYILVWDFWSIEYELDKIDKMINNIQASTSYFSIVLVGTFLDKMSVKTKDKELAINNLKEKMQKKFIHVPILCPVSCVNNEGIDQLRICLYETAKNMIMPGRGKQHLIGRKIPRSYRLMEKRIQEEVTKLSSINKSLFLTQMQFLEIIESIPSKDNDLLSVEETAGVTKFLVETGYLLHFSDQLGALDTLYFLDPAWLCDILVYVLISSEGKRFLKQGHGKISKSQIESLYRDSNQFPTIFIQQYIELLERFELAVSISQSHNLFFPSQLSKEIPMIESTEETSDAKVLRRLYRMAECPSGFWTRLLTRMITRVEQFSKIDWYHRPNISQSVRKATQRQRLSLDKIKEHNKLGLHIKNPRKTFCREWIFVSHDDGSFCVEPVTFPGISDPENKLSNGVLITEMNRKEDFAIMGIIVDEIEDIIQDYYPGLLEPDFMTMSNRLERYALCSTCYSGLLPDNVDHFTMEHCASTLVTGNSILCPKGIKHDLKTLVPDLLMKELPETFFLDYNKLNLQESKEACLGSGVTGSVFRALYDGQAVAVKVYRSNIRKMDHKNSGDSQSSDSGTATLSTQSSTGNPLDDEDMLVNFTEARRSQIDLNEAESMKALKAIKEMRQEVALTSRLQHPCVVSLVGILFNPKLMMALELAPLGSLRNVLDEQISNRPVFNKYRDKDKKWPPLFEKELIFKFVYQIAKGLEYLHSNGIIYKDLKSDNILAMSMDLSAPVNLKLSDYGISKYCWSGRSVGMVGTPGYQAPEILAGLAYDEKADIFAFSMVIYEILTGIRPYAEFENIAQISKAINSEEKRPNLKEFNVHLRFPYLEDLMVSCWQRQAVARPLASFITSKNCLQNMQFISQSSSFTSNESYSFDEQCTLGATANDNKSLLWTWEGSYKDRTLSIMDPEWSIFRLLKSSLPGPKVLCMECVDRQIWIGNEENELEIFAGLEWLSIQKETLELDDTPVEILSIQETSLIPKHAVFSVFVALKNGHVLKFTRSSTLTSKQSPSRIKGFSQPSELVLHSSHICCMALSHDLWVSGSGHIDIVNCKDFKVVTNAQINLHILLCLCQLPAEMDVSQIVFSNGQVFCLLESTPFILEFEESSRNCVSCITLSEPNIYKKIVVRNLDILPNDHKEYHGVHDTCNDDKDNDDDNLNEPLEVINVTEDENYQYISQEDNVEPEKFDFVVISPLDNNAAFTDKKCIQQTENVFTDEKCVQSPILPGLKQNELDSNVKFPDTNISPAILSITTECLSPRACRTQILSQSAPFRADRRFIMDGSRSLPCASKSHQYDIVATSIDVVGTSLWVGRSLGDICVIDMARNKDDINPSFGEVVADMFDNYKKERGLKMVEKVQLVVIGKYVASAYTVNDGGAFQVKIACWESYNAEDIRKVENYWEGILSTEGKLALSGTRNSIATLE